MNQETLTKFRSNANRRASYRDLRAIQDDKTILKNPHKGWYVHYIDNGMGSPYYRDGIPKDDFLLDFPGLNHMYLRFDWGDIEKEAGVYDWSPIDEIMDAWGAKGYTFSFRPCVYEANGIEFATPEWLIGKGCGGTFIENADKRAFEPDYSDPVFMEYLSRYMAAMGERYNGDKRLEYVDVGTYGTWGEGHTYRGSGKDWPVETILWHINLHLKVFPDKFVLLNDDHVMDRKVTTDEDNQRILDYAIGKGLGLRDDSVCVASYCKNYGYNTLAADWMFDEFYKQAPIDVELQHYRAVKDDELKSCFPFLQAMMDTHATYAGFHGYPRPWLEAHKDFTEYAANRLGYWYFLEGIDFEALVSGLPTFFTFHVVNKGFAPCYHKYDAKLKLTNAGSGESAVIGLDMDNRVWAPGRSETRVKARIPNLQPGSYQLSFGLFEGERPIQLGIFSEFFKDGFYCLCEVEVLPG